MINDYQMIHVPNAEAFETQKDHKSNPKATQETPKGTQGGNENRLGPIWCFSGACKGLKVHFVNECRQFLEQKGSPRDPPGGQKGAQKHQKAEKVTFQKHKFSLSETILFEARGSQKAPQGAPKATSNI